MRRWQSVCAIRFTAWWRRGKNEVEIIGWMTERYGDFVRYNPPLTGQTLVLWALPVVLLLLMALILWRVRAKR